MAYETEQEITCQNVVLSLRKQNKTNITKDRILKNIVSEASKILNLERLKFLP